MSTHSDVQLIYSRNTGTTHYFQRPYYSTLLYTDGIMDFQETLDAYWFVDNIISHMPKVLECFNQTEDGFFIIEILLNGTKNSYLEIYREGFNDKNEYDEHITVVRQEIPFIDLPIASNDRQTSYKMYLQLADYTPLRFVLMLTTEY